MHVLFTLGTSGLQKQVVNVINRSDRSRFVHSICCLEALGPLAEALEEPLPTIHLMNKKPGLSFRLPLRLAGLFRREKVHVVHTRTFGPYLYSAFAAKLAGAALIYGEHGDLPMMRHRRRIRTAVRVLARLTTEFYAVTEAGRRCLAELSRRPIERISVIHNGVESEVFKPGDAAAARARVGIPADAFVIGFLGRVAPVKNLAALFGVLPAVHRAVDNAAVLVVGDGPNMEHVRRMAAAAPRPDRVYLVGDRRDVSDLLPAMSACVLPSLSEGHSNTILEAMAAGCPVIASNVGGNPEIVRHNETGFLFPLDQPEEMGERIIELARSDDLRLRLGRRAREVVLSDFSMDAMLRQYEALYDRVARRRRH